MSKISDSSPIAPEFLAFGLSREATRVVATHPEQARLAVKAALEAISTQPEPADIKRSSEIPASLERFIVRRDPGPDMISVTEASKRLGVSRTTVYDWVERGTLLGWRPTRRGVIIPAEQILGGGRVVPGMAEVIAIIGDPELAWAFLAEEWPLKDSVARPIDMLKAGEVSEVLGAASGFGTDPT